MKHIIETEQIENLPRYEQDKFLVRYEDVVKLIANSPQADGMVLVPSEPNNVAYHEVVDALVGMVWQYLEDANGFIDHSFMSAGENAECVLERLGIIKEGEIIDKFKDDGEVKSHIESMLSAYKPQSDGVVLEPAVNTLEVGLMHGLKDHEIAVLVNDITSTLANRWDLPQMLREVVSEAVIRSLEKQNARIDGSALNAGLGCFNYGE